MKKICWILALGILLYIFTEGYLALILILGISIYCILGALLVLGKNKHISGSIHILKEGSKNDESEIVIDVKNLGRWPVWYLDVEVKIENLLNGDEKFLIKTFSLNGKDEKVQTFFHREEHYGTVKISIVDFKIRDGFNCFSSSQISKESRMCCIMPAFTESYLDEEQLFGYDMESFKYSFEKKGNDISEIFGLKEYEEGASIKGIHWKLSGKTGELMVKIPSFPIETKILILFENILSKKSLEKIDKNEIDRQIEIFTNLSYSLLKKEIYHSIGFYNAIDKRFKRFEIKSLEDLYKCIYEALSSPFHTGEETVIDQFINSEEEKVYSLYIYVTNNNRDETEVERLAEYGEVEIYKS